jgi:hypothetical protein
VPDPLVSAIEGPGIASQETPHGASQRPRTRPHQEVGVIREEGPGGDSECSLFRQCSEASHEVRSIRVIPEDELPLQTPHHHMVEGSRGIQTRLAGHGRQIVAQLAILGNVPCSVPYECR